MCAGIVSAQSDKTTQKAAKKAAKETKKAEKEAQKAAEEAEMKEWYEAAKEAIENKDFVVEADRLEFKRGNFVYVNSNTNFVSLKDNKASIQLAFTGNPNSGPNGIGGITVDGTISKYEVKTDKKGNITVTMMVQGIAVSASVTLRIPYGSNKCQATVNPNFHNNRVTFDGYMYPTEYSKVFKGRSI
jgi:hypothetical protein